MPPYSNKFSKGDRVQVVDTAALVAFRAAWRFHDPLQVEQLDSANAVASVKEFGFYHGGDVLYWLEDVPGTWHECCLLEVRER